MNEPTSLHFDPESRRWCIGDRDLHCGDVFKLYPDDKSLPPVIVRIEHASDGWYLITPYGLTKPSTRKAATL